MDRLLIIHNAYDAREFYEDNKNGIPNKKWLVISEEK